MGCNPAIGERADYDDGSLWVVLIEDQPGAPLDSCSMNPDHTGRSNSCAPSYSAWRAFCKRAGVFDLWYGRGAPYSKVDQAVPITKFRLEQVDEAMESVEALSPIDQRRLRWMHWWMHWAVENCTAPVYG